MKGLETIALSGPVVQVSGLAVTGSLAPCAIHRRTLLYLENRRRVRLVRVHRRA